MTHKHHKRSGHRGRSGERRRDPRVERTRAVVLEAARELLVEEGADAVTALRVSERTGIARTTIYRHWPDRQDLLRDTLAAEEPGTRVPLTGDTRTDLIAILTHMGEQIGRRRGARMMAVAVDRSGLRGAAGGPHRDMVRRRLDPLRDVIRAGVETGELSSDLDVDSALASLAGPPFFRAVFLRQEPSASFVVDVVDAFLASRT